MTNSSTQKERILQFIEYKGISKNKFYIESGISNGVLDKKSGLSMETVEKFYSTFPEINPEWLLTGKGDMLKVKSQEVNEPSQDYPASVKLTPKKGIPLIPVDAMAGFGSGTMQVMDYDTEKYIVPEFTELKTDFMIRVKGNSMYPKYNSGDVVACKKLPIDTFFQWNKVYVLDTIQGPMIKRIHSSDNDGYISCVSDNEKYKPFEVSLEDVYSLALVVGVIRLE